MYKVIFFFRIASTDVYPEKRNALSFLLIQSPILERSIQLTVFWTSNIICKQETKLEYMRGNEGYYSNYQMYMHGLPIHMFLRDNPTKMGQQ